MRAYERSFCPHVNVKRSCNIVFTGLGFLLLMWMGSCKNEETPIGMEADYVAEEALTDAYYTDLDDMGDVAVMSDQGTLTGGRQITITDTRFKCAVVTIEFASDSRLLHPKGTITIDFGAGCTDDRGNTRKGKVVIAFDGRRFQPGSTLSASLNGYSINDIAIEGTRTVTNMTGSTSDQPLFRIVLQNGKIVWPGGATATRTFDLTREWVLAQDPAKDQLVVRGSATGVNRSGKSYNMQIDNNDPVTYKPGCPIAVSGKKQFDTDSGSITIDYGNGDCDRSVSLIVNNQRQDISVAD